MSGARREFWPKRFGCICSERDALYIVQQGRCFYCRCQLTDSGTIDHIRPKSFGGGGKFANKVLSCRHCNQRKNSGLVRKSLIQEGLEFFCGLHQDSRPLSERPDWLITTSEEYRQEYPDPTLEDCPVTLKFTTHLLVESVTVTQHSGDGQTCQMALPEEVVGMWVTADDKPDQILYCTWFAHEIEQPKPRYSEGWSVKTYVSESLAQAMWLCQYIVENGIAAEDWTVIDPVVLQALWGSGAGPEIINFKNEPQSMLSV